MVVCRLHAFLSNATWGEIWFMQGEICVRPCDQIHAALPGVAKEIRCGTGLAAQAESMDELAPDWEGRQACLEQSRPPTECCVLLETDKGRGVCSVQTPKRGIVPRG